MKTKYAPPQVLYTEDKPTGVVLDINKYREMLERLEDTEDLALLKKLRSKPRTFRRLEDVLAERPPRV